MTNEEALKLFKDRDLVGRKIFIDEAIDLAIEALEKQIPKKPRTIKREINGSPFIHTFCPYYFEYSNDEVSMWDCLIDEIDNYCHRCGQAIDWSD